MTTPEYARLVIAKLLAITATGSLLLVIYSLLLTMVGILRRDPVATAGGLYFGTVMVLVQFVGIISVGRRNRRVRALVPQRRQLKRASIYMGVGLCSLIFGIVGISTGHSTQGFLALALAAFLLLIPPPVVYYGHLAAQEHELVSRYGFETFAEYYRDRIRRERSQKQISQELGRGERWVARAVRRYHWTDYIQRLTG